MSTPIMDRTEIGQEVRNFLINNVLFGRADALQDDASLLGQVLDSTAVVELVIFLQERFGITVEDEEVAVPDNFDSVKNIVGYVEKKLRSTT
jgi:acyl carrier protein